MRCAGVLLPLDTRKNISTVLALSDGTIYVPRGSTDTLSVSSSDSSKLLLIGSGNSPKVATLGLGDVVLTLTDSLQGLTTQIVVSITN